MANTKWLSERSTIGVATDRTYGKPFLIYYEAGAKTQQTISASTVNQILNFRHSLIFCIVVSRVGTSGRRNTFSIIPIS